MKKIFLSLTLLLTLTSVVPVYAQNKPLDYSGLVQCDGVKARDGTEPGRQRECDFAALVNMINYVIRWVFGLTIPIFIALFAYAGFLYMTPNPSNRTKAKSMLWAAIKGFVIMLCAYFIVTTLMKWLVNPKFEGTDALKEIKK